MRDLRALEPLLRARMEKTCNEHPDPSHDILHVDRVVRTAKSLASTEGGNLWVIIPAAYLHDCVAISKSDPRRSKASQLSATEAKSFLAESGWDEALLEPIAHAIESHSFSAGITPTTLEAKIVQDADRLDALGAVGIARCFATGGTLARTFYSADDPFCVNRPPMDSIFTVDHFFAKLLKLPATFQTEAGRKEGHKRAEVLKTYLADFKREIEGS